MNYANLAKAIQIKAKLVPFFFYKHNYNTKFHDYIISEVQINNDITITIKDFYVEEYNCTYITIPHQIMKTATYIEDVKVNEYTFLCKSDRWKLLSKEIYHPIPDSIIQIINNWSLNCVKKHEENQERKNISRQINEQQNYSKEENILKSIFKKYE